MLFRGESSFAHYFWNGTNVILVYLPGDINPAPYYWMGNPNDAPPPSEVSKLNEIASGHNKVRIFKLANRTGVRYIIMERGKFAEE